MPRQCCPVNIAEIIFNIGSLLARKYGLSVLYVVAISHFLPKFDDFVMKTSVLAFKILLARAFTWVNENLSINSN